MKKAKDFLENRNTSRVQDELKDSLNEKPGISANSTLLTPSEIDSLRKDLRDSLKRSEQREYDRLTALRARDDMEHPETKQGPLKKSGLLTDRDIYLLKKDVEESLKVRQEKQK